ncbi:MAG: hypothetical protein WCT46_05305 [Candidatus Gracilibacteria bacterium]|jgi:hypothetical protein
MVSGCPILGDITAFDRELLNRYPLIERAVPGRPLLPEEVDAVNRTRDGCLAEMRSSSAMAALMREGGADERIPYEALCRYSSSETYAPRTTLLTQLLPHATDPDQVRQLVWGYIVSCCMQENGGNSMFGFALSNYSYYLSQMPRPMYYALASSARNGQLLKLFIDGADIDQVVIYVAEGSADSALVIMADPGGVPSSVDDLPNVRRAIPDEKRMTSAKLSRLLQLPGLNDYMTRDKDDWFKTMSGGTNLAIIAEYFCENDDAVNMNEITVQNVNDWLVAKFEKNKPGLDVAHYQLFRLQGTAFSEVGNFIQEYILDLHQSERPWLFELAGITRADCGTESPLFFLYSKVLVCVIDERVPIEDSRLVELGSVLPGKEWSRSFIRSESNFIWSFSSRLGSLTDRISELSLSKIAGNNDVFNAFALDFFKVFDGVCVVDEWVEHPGFEILDPMMISKYANENYASVSENILKVMVEKIKGMSSLELLRFKNEVADRLPADRGAYVQSLITELAQEMAVRVHFESLDPEVLVAVARGDQSSLLKRSIILPGDVGYGELVGLVRREPLAERALLNKYLRGVRGWEQIIRYLLSHSDSMRPSELILPYPDAPNREVIREYGDSPDLLSLLQMATLLVYLGYNPDQIMVEIAAQAQLSSQGTHSSLTTVGLEFEQLGASEEGIIINPTRFSWLFNALAAGLDPNEVMTAATASGAMQGLMMSMITDGRFQFMNPDMLWGGQAGSSPRSSLHLNMALPQDLPFNHHAVEKAMSPLQLASWFMHDNGNAQVPQGSASFVRGWRKRSLLDVYRNKRPDLKFELRRFALEKDGSHLDQILWFQMLGSAGMQYMREEAALILSPSEKIMSGLYRAFAEELRSVRTDGSGVAMAGEIVKKYASQVAAELCVSNTVEKKSGIVLTDRRGVVVSR